MKKISFGRESSWYVQESGGWFTKSCGKLHGCSFWKGIMLCKEYFESRIHYVVGKGTLVILGRSMVHEEKVKTKFSAFV